MSDLFCFFSTRRWVGVVLLAAALAGTGCGGGTDGRVTGTVKLRGQPLTDGEVHFHLPEKGVGAVAPLDASGKFAFPDPLPVGTYAAAVQPRPPEPGMPASKAAAAVPAKYRDGKTSGLSFTVKGGSNDFPIDLTD